MIKGRKILVPTAFLAFLVLVAGFATQGDCSDSGFNPPKGFILYNDTPKGNDWGHATAIQPDGKIVAVGVSYNGTNYRTLVLRFNSDGTRDKTFGVGGAFTFEDNGKGNNYGYGVALQSDGKIVVVGHADYNKKGDVLVLRCNNDGSLDTAFGKGGAATYQSGTGETQNFGFGATLQPDEKIIVTGAKYYNGTNSEAIILRYNSDGSLDSSFGNGAVINHSGSSNANIWDHAVGRAIAIQADGKILMLGVSYTAGKSDVFTVRYNTDGSIDKSFGEEGVALLNCPIGGHYFGRSIAIQLDGKIIIAGNTHNGGGVNPFLLRYNVDGKPDTTFGNGGFAAYKTVAGRSEWSSAVVLLPDGKILMVGNSVSGPKSEVLAVRYNSDGSLDNSFGNRGTITSNWSPNSSDWGRGVAIQPDGRIVVVGYNQMGKNQKLLVITYKTDGAFDTPFDSTPCPPSFLSGIVVCREGDNGRF